MIVIEDSLCWAVERHCSRLLLLWTPASPAGSISLRSRRRKESGARERDTRWESPLACLPRHSRAPLCLAPITSKRLPGRLWLNTKECISSLLDSYVKVYLLVAGKRAKKKKTSVRKGTLNPVFNEAVSFDIAMDALNSVDLLLSVMHENEIIGCVPIGAHSTGKELDHWREVRTANKPVAHWHSLQDPKKFY